MRKRIALCIISGIYQSSLRANWNSQLEFFVAVLSWGYCDLIMLDFPSTVRQYSKNVRTVGQKGLPMKDRRGNWLQWYGYAFSWKANQARILLRFIYDVDWDRGGFHQPGLFAVCLHSWSLPFNLFMKMNIDYFHKIYTNLSVTFLHLQNTPNTCKKQTSIAEYIHSYFCTFIFQAQIMKKQSLSNANSLMEVGFCVWRFAIPKTHNINNPSMKSCRVSICQLRASDASSQASSRIRPNKYSAFMQQRSCQKHTTTPSTDSLALLPPAARPRDFEFFPEGYTGRDQMFVLLKGKNFFTDFQKTSKHTPTQPAARPFQLLQPHLGGQKREQLKRKRLARNIEQDRLNRQESERKFLRKTLTVQLGLNCKNTHFC